MNKNHKIIVITGESVLNSIIKDTFTFLMFAGLLYFNHKILSGSTVVDVLFILMALVFLVAKKSEQYFEGTKEEAIKFLSESEGQNG